MSIKDSITDYLKSGETRDQKLGLEIEHFIVNGNGEQMCFEEITFLIKEVATIINADIHYIDGFPVGYYNGRYSISLEPACQFEISIDPYSDLETIKEIYGEFRSLWDPVFKTRGYHFETYGNLPVVELGIVKPDDIPLSPKKRYKYMDNYFKTSGKYGKYMMRASASTQVSVDYRSEEDMAKKLRVLEKLSPILAIVMENKYEDTSSLPGRSDRPHLLRIQEWDDLDPARTGFIEGSLDKDFGYEQIAEVVYNTPLILLSDNGETVGVGSQSARDLFDSGYLNEGSIDEPRRTKLIEHFMSMGFFHYRVKKYIEIRVADSVPIDRALGYVALLKGILYSDAALNTIDWELSTINSAEQIQQAIESIEKDGFNALTYYGKTAGEWADHLIRIASTGLSGEDKEYLNNVRTVWDHIQSKGAC